jgi:hypothetical protein
MTSQHFDAQALYRIACCGLKAAESLLKASAIPLPERRGIIAHDPELFCGCDALFICPTDSDNTGDDEADGCNVVRRTMEFEVHISRCVALGDPTKDCPEDVDCCSVLDCPGADARPRPEPCEPAPDKAHETMFLLEERWLLETYLASAWSACLCQGGPCGDGCGDDDCAGGCRHVRWVNSRRFDEGGCGGTIMLFELRWP